MNPIKTDRAAVPSPSAVTLRKSAIFYAALLVGTLVAIPASAQITPSRSMSGTTPVATLEEQLTNRLRATTDTQAEYIRLVVKLVDEKKLEARLVIAVEQYALRKNPRYPFPYFERALRYESAKRGVVLVPLRHFQSTAQERL